MRIRLSLLALTASSLVLMAESAFAAPNPGAIAFAGQAGASQSSQFLQLKGSVQGDSGSGHSFNYDASKGGTATIHSEGFARNAGGLSGTTAFNQSEHHSVFDAGSTGNGSNKGYGSTYAEGSYKGSYQNTINHQVAGAGFHYAGAVAGNAGGINPYRQFNLGNGETAQ